MKYILVVDEGTSSVRAIIFDETGNIAQIERQKLNLELPHPGYVECDAMEIWKKTKKVMQDVVNKSNISLEDILSIGTTTQRESAVIWDRKTGEPIFNCITWLDRRTDSYCDELCLNPENSLNLHRKTGLFITSFHPAVKIAWMLDNIPGARERAERGELCFGTIDTWLFYNMTGKKRFVAEQSIAARTRLFNIHTLEWDFELLEMFNVPLSMLAPEILSSDAYFGETADIFDKPIPIHGSLGDQQAASFGNQCFDAGSGKISLGTAGAMSVNIGQIIPTSQKLQGTLGWNVKGKVSYHYESGFYFCGGIMDWLEKMGMITSSQEATEIAESVSDTAGVSFVSTFFGLMFPEFIDDCRGMITGLTPSADKRHIVRAALEAIAFQTKDCHNFINSELEIENTGIAFSRLSVDGGVSNSNFVVQMIADLLNIKAYKNEDIESAATGAFYISALSCGLFDSTDDIRAKVHKNISTYTPAMKDETRCEKYEVWQNALKSNIFWAKNIK